MKQLIKKIFQLQKTVTGEMKVNAVQSTVFSIFGIPLFERRRILLGVAPIAETGGGGLCRSAQYPHGLVFFKMPVFN